MVLRSEWPCEDECRRLLESLLRAEATAPNAVAAAFINPLTAYLRAKFPGASPDLYEDAVMVALTDFFQCARKYDPHRHSLVGYLQMLAWRDFLNLWEKESRHQRRRIPLDSVEESAAVGNSISEPDADAPSWDDPRLAAELETFTPPERLVCDMMRAGERATPKFARVLGLDETRPDAARVVKRFKDKVMARLRRAVGGSR